MGDGLSYESIDLDSVRYGYSYSIEQYVETSNLDLSNNIYDRNYFSVLIEKNQLKELFNSWYDNPIWHPLYVYRFDSHEKNSYGNYDISKYYLGDISEYNWHPMGIVPNCYYKHDIHDGIMQIQDYDDADYFEVIFELATPLEANSFPFSERGFNITKLIPAYAEPDPTKVYRTNNHYTVLKPSNRIKEWKYTTADAYAASVEERWLTQKVYEFPAGAYVPDKHWPQMLYEKKKYDDVEQVHNTEMIYPEFGYYPPAHEMLPDSTLDTLEEGVHFYRYVGKQRVYHSTVKAATIYLPIGADIEELNLTAYNTEDPIELDESNLYGYKYLGQEEVTNKNALTSIATSEDFGAYPKDGLSTDGYWYEYIGTNEQISYTWDELELRSVPTYNLDINSNQDFTIGDVASASFTADVQGNVKENIQYLGRKCQLYYDFENKGEYKDFGLFTIDDVKFMNHQVSTITAYDNIKKFDAPVYEYLTSDNVKPLYPMTAKTLFQLMCEYCEVPYYTTMDFLNSDKLCYGPFGDANLTARQVLSYIAEIAAGYVVCDVNGFAVLKTHKPYNDIEGQEEVPYTTDYENLLPLITSFTGKVSRELYSLQRQSSQKMDIFPTEIIDSSAFNNADAETFINYRTALNAIYDFSDNPFAAYITTQAKADELTNGILDQIALLAPDEDKRFYSGEIQLKEVDMISFGNKTIVRLLDYNNNLFIPTTININESGITLEGKGQPKYSTKIVNSELAKQVDSLKMNIKEIKLTIPDALSDTLDNHGQQITSIESDLGAVQSDVSAVQASVSSLDTELETQKTETSTQFSNVQRRDDGQDDRLDALEAKDTQHDTSISELTTTTNSNTSSISSLNTTVGTHSTSISNLQNTVGGLPTKQYVDDLNQIETINNGLKLKIGEGEISFTANNGYLLISDGTTV